MVESIHIIVLILTFRLGLSINQLSPLRDIVYAFDNAAKLSLNDFFEGQNLTYSSKNELSIVQRLELDQSLNRNTTTDPSRQIGLIKVNQENNYLFTLEKTSFSIWNTSDIGNLTLLSTTSVENASMLVSLDFLDLVTLANSPCVTVINQNALNYTLHIFDVSDITNIHEIEGSRLTVESSDPVVQVNSLSNQAAIYVETSGNDTNLDIIYAFPNNSAHVRFNGKDIGLENFYTVGIGSYFEHSSFMCDMNNGIIEFRATVTKEFSILNIQRDPLSYGKITSCYFYGENVTVATTNEVLAYSLDDLSFIGKYYRYPWPSKSNDPKKSPKISAQNNLIGTYCLSDNISFSIIDIKKGLQESLLLDEFVSELFEDQIPMYALISQDHLFYVIFALKNTLEVYRIHEKPYIYLPAISAPKLEKGSLLVKNSLDSIEVLYQIQRIDSNSLEIRDWRGPYPDYGFIKIDSFPLILNIFSNNKFFLPISNYFSGQGIELSAALVETPEMYNIDVQLNNKIELKSTTDLSEFPGDDLKLYTSSYFLSKWMAAVPGGSYGAYLIQLGSEGLVGSVINFYCQDRNRNMTETIFVSRGFDFYVIAECTGEDVVWDLFRLEDVEANYLNSIKNQKNSKFSMIGSHFLSMRSDSIIIYSFDPDSENILINSQIIDNNTIPNFSPIELVSSHDEELIVYDKLLGLIQFYMNNWESPFEYTILGKLGRDIGERVKLSYFTGNFYGYIPQTDGSNGIFKIFIQENKIEGVERYPDFNKKYTEIFSSGTFLYLVSEDNCLMIFDTLDYSFEALFKSVSIPNKFTFGVSLIREEMIYIYHKDQLDMYEILVSDSNVHSNLVPSDSASFHSFVILTVTPKNNKMVAVDTAKLEITAKNSTLQLSKTVDINLYFRGDIVEENPHFNKESNLLTHKSLRHVESPITEELPLGYFIGNDIDFHLESRNATYLPQPSCNSSTPICLESKVFYKNHSTADDFTFYNNSLYLISGAEILEYSLNGADWIHEASYDLRSILGVIACKRIEHIPYATKIVLVSCEYSNFTLEISIIDLGSEKRISSVPISTHSRLIYTDSSRIFTYDGARLTIYNCNGLDHSIETYIVLTSESFHLDSFEVVGIESYIEGTYILFTSQEMLLVKYPSQIISTVKLNNAYYDLGTASIASGSMLSDNKTIYAVDSYGSLYKFKIENFNFEQLQQWPNLSYNDRSFPCKIGISEYHSMIGIPINGLLETGMRYANFSKDLLEYIYSELYVKFDKLNIQSCKSKLIDLEGGILNVYGIHNESSMEIYTSFVNPSPKFYAYPTSDINETSISLCARSETSGFEIGNLTLNFVPSHKDSPKVTSKWWFWFIMAILISIFLGIAAFLVVRLIKKRKTKTSMKDYDLEEILR